jgi:hypothetical protein
MGLREDILKLYQESPMIGSTQISACLGIKPTPQFWRILNEIQVELRGVPARVGRKGKRMRYRNYPKGYVRSRATEGKIIW